MDVEVQFGLDLRGDFDRLHCWLVIADQSLGPIELSGDEIDKVWAPARRLLSTLGADRGKDARPASGLLAIRMLTTPGDTCVRVSATGLGCNLEEKLDQAASEELCVDVETLVQAFAGLT